MDTQKFELIAKLLRYYSIVCSSKAGSGHPTSSLSAADIMAVLYFNFLKYDFDHPNNRFNDRLIFSKGHATPLLYSLFKVAGRIDEEELLTYRTLYSPLQGHPTPETPYTDVATGSLGMGLSFGLGMALANKMDGIPNKTYVLLGDGEMAEGNVWEALEVASHYQVNNLIGIIDVNRLEQTGTTMLAHDVDTYQHRVASFGWQTAVIDGHNVEAIEQAFTQAHNQTAPFMIIAKTIKGKGISIWEDQENWHSKILNEEQLAEAKKELNLQSGQLEQTFKVNKPEQDSPIAKKKPDTSSFEFSYEKHISNGKIATKAAFGSALAELAKNNHDLLVLDGDVSNSSMTGEVKQTTPDQFLNLFIAEQNMIGVGVGMAKMGKAVYAATFAAFLTRAYDQIRIASLSEANLKLNGSYVGVSIGMDGASQMGLEDIAMMRAVLNSTVLYPCDPVSTGKLTQSMLQLDGVSYIRTTREPTPVIYSSYEQFPVGGSKTLRQSDSDQLLIIAAGITLHEALKAHTELQNQGINVRVVDLYSIKPIDADGLKTAAQASQNRIITIEDHYYEGGIGDAVLNVFAQTPVQITKMAITGRPHSGKPDELIEHYGISAKHLIEKVKELVTIHQN